MTLTAPVTLGQSDLASVKQAARDVIEEWADRLVELSHTIHDHPETAFQEHAAARAVAATLDQAGFRSSVGVHGLDTAVEAVAGSGEFTVAVCAEYDALPGIGHGCGHNVIAAAGVGAAIGLAAVAEQAGLRVKLLGTPAEEHGGGKVLMLEAGAWEDATISLMVHGGPGPDLRCGDLTSQAVDRFQVAYTGRPAHAAAAPQAGVNALDAATVALVAIGLLRQQLPASARVAAIVADGGQATNIIPGRAVVDVEVRSFTVSELDGVKRRVLACVEAGAVASGCTWEVTPSQPRYANLVQEPLLAPAWDAALAELGRPTIPLPGAVGGSTDMGNVSHVVPSIHPMIGLPGTTAPPHTAEFAVAARSADGDRAVVDAAVALAWTVVEAALDPATRAGLLERQERRGPGATTSPQGEA